MVRAVRDRGWQRFLGALRAFHSREGHCQVPYRHVEEGYKLGYNAKNVRFRQDFIKDNKARTKLLAVMGFRFREGAAMHREERWGRFLEKLQTFSVREGDHKNTGGR